MYSSSSSSPSAVQPDTAAPLDKNQLRQHARASRRALFVNKPLHEKLSLQIQNNILNSVEWDVCHIVCLYYAVRGEVLTEKLMQQAWLQGKTVLLPLCRPNEIGMMDFAQCQSYDDLQDGLFGIPEPRPHCPVFSPEDIERDAHALILVPALVYDKRGFRLGYGRGYYDRFLDRLQHSYSVGLAFQDQLATELPADPWDQPVYYLATENGMNHTARQD